MKLHLQPINQLDVALRSQKRHGQARGVEEYSVVAQLARALDSGAKMRVPLRRSDPLECIQAQVQIGVHALGCTNRRMTVGTRDPEC